MAAKITIEAILYTLVYSAFMLVLFKIQGAKHQLYNYPPAIRERAVEKGIITQEELGANAKKNKIIGLLVMVGLCVPLEMVLPRTGDLPSACCDHRRNRGTDRAYLTDLSLLSPDRPAGKRDFILPSESGRPHIKYG